MRTFRAVNTFGIIFGLAVVAACDTVTQPGPAADVSGVEGSSPAASWDYRVNGGGEMLAGSTPIFIQVSASDFDGGKGVKGQVEYEALNDDGSVWFKWHAQVDEFRIGTAADGSTVVNLCGSVTNVQEGAHESFYEGAPIGVAIKDVDGGPDRMRQNGDEIDCQSLYTGSSFPAEMVDGDFRVKDRS